MKSKWLIMTYLTTVNCDESIIKSVLKLEALCRVEILTYTIEDTPTRRVSSIQRRQGE